MLLTWRFENKEAGREKERKWICPEPGVLALADSEWRIEYQPHYNGDYHLMQGRRSMGRFFVLMAAKMEALNRQADLEEIGMG